MFSLYLECRQEEKDILVAELWERGSAGITESEVAGSRTGLRAFFAADSQAPQLEQDFSSWSARCAPETSRDWVAVAQSLLEPQCVGSRFFLVPKWRDDPTPAGRFRIVVNPGMAFGTGAHESTQLCLEALENELRPGMVVLDVGTGSGILAEAAGLLGAKRVIACDIDPIAVQLARQRLSFIGTADAIRAASAGLVVANISPEAIIMLAPEVVRVLHKGGKGILSGFEAAEVPAVEMALRAEGAAVVELHSKGSWTAMTVLV
jgi:ribosomal protein L11 methyltransferase